MARMAIITGASVDRNIESDQTAQREFESSQAADTADSTVVLLWCGLRDYNTIGRFSSLTHATECVRVLAAKGFTQRSMSTVAVIGDEQIQALVGVHSDDLGAVDRASAVMRAANARVCCF